MNESNESTLTSEKKEPFQLCVMIIVVVLSFLVKSMTKTIAIRVVCLILIAFGVENKKIASLVGCSDRTVRNLRNKIRGLSTKELPSLLEFKKGSGRQSKVTAEHEKSIIEEVDKNNYSTQIQIINWAKEKLNLVLGRNTLSRILRKYGCKRRVVESLPAKADPEVQKNFYNQEITPLIEKAKTGLVKLFYLDGSHMVLSFRFLGSLYGTFRKIVKTFTGNKRYNVLGALDLQTKDLISCLSTKNITSEIIVDFFINLAFKYYNKQIYIVLDRARYQDCKLVKKVAYQLGINLLFLPAYSPNLNFIERVWKFMKGKLRVKYYDDFQTFVEAIDNLLVKINTEYKKDIQSLIGENVQFYDELTQLTDGTFKRESHKDNSVAA